MLGRRRIDTPAPIRSSLADAAFAVEERVVWGGADVLRGIVDVVKWPFERAIWAIERGLVWPLEERTGDWSHRCGRWALPPWPCLPPAPGCSVSSGLPAAAVAELPQRRRRARRSRRRSCGRPLSRLPPRPHRSCKEQSPTSPTRRRAAPRRARAPARKARRDQRLDHRKRLDRGSGEVGETEHRRLRRQRQPSSLPDRRRPRSPASSPAPSSSMRSAARRPRSATTFNADRHAAAGPRAAATAAAAAGRRQGAEGEGAQRRGRAAQR